jgi:hypothetical protein
MFGLEELYLMNLIMTIVLVAATLFRVKIEHEHTKAVKEDLFYKKKIKALRDTLIREKEMICKSPTEEDVKKFYEFLIEYLENGET